jgi:hypothetical protein
MNQRFGPEDPGLNQRMRWIHSPGLVDPKTKGPKKMG